MSYPMRVTNKGVWVDMRPVLAEMRPPPDTHCTLCDRVYLSSTYRPAEDGTAVLGPSDRPCCPSGCDQGLFGEKL